MLRNTTRDYGYVAIIFHWSMAFAIFGMFGLGLYMVELTYYDAWRKGSLSLHKSVGICLVLIWLGRVIWRKINVIPQALGSNPIEQKAAHWVHRILYVLMASQFISGYLISTADGRAVSVFDFASVPATLTTIANQEDIAGLIHQVLAWTLITFISLHVLAAIKHHLVNRDRTLLRMMKPKRN